MVGKEDYPCPIPIVKQKGKWFFDTKVGKEEVLNRRIGANELDAIAICRGFDEAQHEYAEEKHDDAKVNQYAQRVISTPGKHDGLAWQNADGTWGGPVGEGVAKALEQGYTERTQPYHGYYFKVLKKQGPAAPGGGGLIHKRLGGSREAGITEQIPQPTCVSATPAIIKGLRQSRGTCRGGFRRSLRRMERDHIRPAARRGTSGASPEDRVPLRPAS